MRCYSLSLDAVFPLEFIESVLVRCVFLPPFVLSVGDRVSCGSRAAVADDDVHHQVEIIWYMIYCNL